MTALNLAGRANSFHTHTAVRGRRGRRVAPILLGYSTEPRTMDSQAASSDNNPDRMREGAVRYLGYANECGESFRPLWPRWAVNTTYGVAGAYVVADAAWRSSMPPPGRTGLVEAVDTLLWQGLASVAVPGIVINRVVAVVGHYGPLQHRAWLPTAMGLASIPFIVRPIDHLIDVLMDGYVRPMYAKSGRQSKAA